MPSQLMDEEQLKQWILRRLGGSMWKVELTQDELDDCVENARRWFSAKKGVRKRMEVNFFPGVVEYRLDDQVDVVLDVLFPANPLDISLVFSPYILQGEKVPYDVFAAASSGGVYSTYTQTLQYIETAKRVLNAEPDWRQEGRLLYIMPVPNYSSAMLIEYKSHDFTIEQLGERDHDLVKRYALADAKHMLGRVRSKYQEFPGAQGPVQLDGDRLLTESKDEMDTLQREIGLSAYPMGFILD